MNDLLKITKERLKNHLHYTKWYYFAAIAVVLIIVNVAYTISEPRCPGENKVNIMIYGGAAEEDATVKWENDMLGLLPDDQREVNILASISVDELTQPVVMARIAAREDDVIVMDTENIKSYAAAEAFLPLDEYMDLDKIFAMYPDIDRSEFYTKISASQEESAHIYWLPLYAATGLEELNIYGENLGIAIAANSENPVNAAICAEYMMTKN